MPRSPAVNAGEKLYQYIKRLPNSRAAGTRSTRWEILLGTTMAVCTAPRGGNIWLCVYQAVLTSPLHASTHQLGLTATSACVWSSSHAWRRFCSEILCLVRAQGPNF